MKTAAITGITGQDGALLAKLLVEKGYAVIGLTSPLRNSDFKRLDYLSIHNRVQLHQLDLLNYNAVTKFLADQQPEEFYNLAAVSSVGYSFGHPSETFEFNTRSVIAILESIRKVSPKTKFYQASSSEMFGNVGEKSLPLKESFLFHPVSPYGISKASAHWLTVNYREAYKLQACCGILFNHESALRGPDFVIKKIVRTALRIKSGEQTKLTLGNLSVVRDWGYAPMYVDAMWRMMQQEKMDDYLICSGQPTSLDNFVTEVFRQLDLNREEYVTIDGSLKRSLDLQIIYGDNSKAKEELQWPYHLDPKSLISRLIQDEKDLMRWEEEIMLKK